MDFKSPYVALRYKTDSPHAILKIPLFIDNLPLPGNSVSGGLHTLKGTVIQRTKHTYTVFLRSHLPETTLRRIQRASFS